MDLNLASLTDVLQQLGWIGLVKAAGAYIYDAIAGMTLLQAMEWAGSIMALAGSAILAAKVNISRYAWWIYLGSNMLLCYVCFHMGATGMMTMQMGFMLTSIIGVARAFPLRARAGTNAS